MENQALNKTLKQFFTVSVAAFEMQRTVIIALGGKYHMSNMHSLHLEAQEEMDQDNPDMERIESLLERMEYLAKSNNQ